MRFFLAKLFSTFFFVGLIKKAPGTFGTLAGAILIFPVFAGLSMLDLQYIIYATFLFGTISTKIYMSAVKRDDPKEVVIDEVVGIWICLAICKFFLPHPEKWEVFLLAFSLFRLFDIAKPFPISYVDKNLKNALGVMLDDILAGIFAGILTSFIFKLLQ